MTIAATGGKTRTRILPLVILTPIVLGLPPVNTMEKRTTQTLIMMTEKRGENLFFFVQNYHLTSAAQCGIIVVGINGPPSGVAARVSDLLPHMENFLLKARAHMRAIFSQN